MALVLSRSEVERMKKSILPPSHDTTKEDIRKKRKELSEDKLKHWPNTLEALRKKKESFIKDKEDRLEAERQEVDLQEAELRRKNRLEAIRRANELLYEQTDKMKNFRSQQLYCDVLETRIGQIDGKKVVKEQEKKEAAEYHQVILEKVRKGDDEDKVKAEKVVKTMQEVAKSREQQRQEVRLMRERAKQEEIDVGLAIKRRAQEAVEEDIEAYQAKLRAAHESNLKMIEANEKIKQEKEALRAQEEAAVAVREKEIAITESRTLARKALEKRRFEKKQVQRQMIIDAAVEALAKKSSNENALQMKQEAELQEKEDKKEADKAAKREQEWNDIVESRSAMVIKRREQRQREAEETAALAEFSKQQALAGIAEEKDKAVKAREMTIMIKNMQLEQAVETNKRNVSQKVKELEETKALQGLSNQDDDKFNQLAKQTIERYVEKGVHNVIPMMRALEYSQPDLLPSIKKPENNIKNRPKED